jgi:hypothetical protein
LQNEQRYSQISNFLRYRFGVGLLETTPEIVPLWPPVIEQDVLIPTKDSKIFCAIASGNDEPTVYSYVGNQVLNIPVQNSWNGEKHIYVRVGTTDTVLSVDRKYVGREIVFRAKEVASEGVKYEYSFCDAEGKLLELEEIHPHSFANGGSIISNTKFELYIGSNDHNYLHIPIRSDHTLLPTFQNAYTVLFKIEGGTIDSLVINEPQRNPRNAALQLDLRTGQFRGEYIPVPRWAYQTIENMHMSGSQATAQAILSHIVNGKLPIGIIKALGKYRKSTRSV